MAEARFLEFFDAASERFMRLMYDGPYAGWIFFRHPDGQWVSLRKATDDDMDRINGAVIRAHCGSN